MPKASFIRFLLFSAFLMLTLVQVSCHKPVDDEKADSIQHAFQSFGYLNEFVGKSPDAVGLWQTEPLHAQLSKLVGDSLLQPVLRKLQTAQVLKRDHVLYTIAPLPDSMVYGYAVALFDTIEPAVDIMYIQKDTVQEIKSGGDQLYWPDEVRNLVFNYQGWEVYEGILPCDDCEGIRTTLALDSAGSTYQFFLQQTYLHVEEGVTIGDTVKQYRGICEMLNAEDSVFHIAGDDMHHAINLLKKNGLELELLNNELQKIETDQNLLLSKIN